MRDIASNDNMEPNLDLLKTIRKVEAPDGLYQKIIIRAKKKADVIPMVWVKTAAAIFIGIIAVESLLITNKVIKKDQKQGLEVLVSIPNNMLYE